MSLCIHCGKRPIKIISRELCGACYQTALRSGVIVVNAELALKSETRDFAPSREYRHLLSVKTRTALEARESA